MFALRGLARNNSVARLPTRAVALQQKRAMSGGEDEDPSLFSNWWDAPTNPDSWHRHHLAWWAAAFWAGIFGTVYYRSGSSAPAEVKPAS